MNEVLTVATVAFFVALIGFLVLREVWCWYWKQSEQVELLKEIRDSLRRLEAQPYP